MLGMLDSALLAAILEEPSEDLPRLEMADWLDENEPDNDGRWAKWLEAEEKQPGSGGPEPCASARAEFIRVQCRITNLANLLNDCWCDDGRGDSECKTCITNRVEWENLSARERELLIAGSGIKRNGITYANWQEWTGMLPHYLFHEQQCVYRRGFIHTLRCSAAEWQRETVDNLPANLVREGLIPSAKVTPSPTIGQQILRSAPVEKIEFTDAPISWLKIKHSPSNNYNTWELWIQGNTVVRSGICIEHYATRDALIDAMPRQLESWGVGGHHPVTITGGNFTIDVARLISSR